MERFTDLPVAVELPGRLGQEVAAYVEAEAGWQVVAGDGPLVPAFALCGPEVQSGRRVVVVPAPADGATVRAALLAGAMDVIAWPDDRERLLSLPRRIGREGGRAPATPVLRVGASRGGVGASTVALAVGAVVAWSGGTALVVGDEPMLRLAGRAPWKGPGTGELMALGDQAGEEVERLAVGVPGVEGLAVLGGGPLHGQIDGWPYDLVVVDAGVGPGALVVAGADAAVATVQPAARLVVVEHGPLDRAGVARCLGWAPNGWLPYSNRVARAGTVGRVPSALPGSWVKALRAALAGVAQ